MFKRIVSVALVTASFALTGISHAHSFKVAELEVIHPNARPSLPGQLNGAAWFGVRNNGETADRIVGVKSDVAAHTEVHDMKVENDIMRMFKVDAIDVPAKTTLRLGDGNKLHVMLMELKAPLKEGEKFTLEVEFEKAGVVPVEVWVEKDAGKSSGKNEHDHSQQGGGEAHQH